RLEAVGLGEFILPLQAERSSREAVISSVRERVEMAAPRPPKDYDRKIAAFRAVRSEIAAYIDVMSRPFEQTGFTVHDIHWKSVATSSALDGKPRELQTPTLPAIGSLD